VPSQLKACNVGGDVPDVKLKGMQSGRTRSTTAGPISTGGNAGRVLVTGRVVLTCRRVLFNYIDYEAVVGGQTRDDTVGCPSRVLK